MRSRLLMIFALAALSASCADEPSSTMSSDSDEVAELGGLTIGLTGTDRNGVQYRLRDAEFLIQKEAPPGSDAGLTPLQTLSTEHDPNAPYLSTRLGSGFYTVTLRGSWYVERMAAGGHERVQRAVLLSSVTQRTHVIGRAGAALVFYRFGIDGEVVDFDSGELRIDVDFELPRDGGMRDAGRDAGPSDAGADAGDAAGPNGDAAVGLDAGMGADSSGVI